MNKPVISSTITEPFITGRSASCLLFDFSVMASLLNPANFQYPILDFGAGTGWISEFCARMGLQTLAYLIFMAICRHALNTELWLIAELIKVY